MASRRSSPGSIEHISNADGLAAPEDLDARSFAIGSDEYVILAFSVTPDQPVLENAGRLTASELAIAELVLQGHATAEIARARGRSVRTIANQIAAIYRKLGVKSRRELFALQRSQRAET